jgi:hypothetical protein
VIGELGEDFLVRVMMRRSTLWRLWRSMSIAAAAGLLVVAVVAFVSHELVLGLAAIGGLALTWPLDADARRRRRHAPTGGEAQALYRELETITSDLRGQTVISRCGDAALHFPADQPGAVVRVGADQMDDDRGVVTGEQFIVTPYPRIVLHRILGANYESDEHGGMLWQDSPQPRVNVFKEVRFALRTGAGIASVEEMRELAEQIHTARRHEAS